LDETAGAPNEVKPQEFPPVVGVDALLKGGQRADRALVLAKELRLTQLSVTELRLMLKVTLRCLVSVTESISLSCNSR
jgi:hypothetical protein